MSHYRKAMYRCGGNECDRVHMTDGGGVDETPLELSEGVPNGKLPVYAIAM